jgi:uncharacterized protein YcbK (DUF882 family)
MPYVKGAFVHGVSHIADVFKSNNVYANNVPVALWDQPGPTSAVIGGVYISDNPFQFTFVETLVNEAGANAHNDDGEGTDIPGIPDNSLESTTSTSVATSTAVNQGVAVDGVFTDTVDYNQKLSTNFAVKDLSVNTIFPHNIVAQNGLSIPDILQNMQAVAVNILEPLRAQYPGLRINSAFRKGAGTSQHNKGQAVDIQWPGLSPAGYTPIAQWITANLPVDQLIFEHGNSIWLHISYNRTLSNQRGQLLTYYPKESPQYKPGLTNRYA